MTKPLFSSLLLLLPFTLLASSQETRTYEDLRKEAEELVARRSYERAHELFVRARAVAPDEEAERWSAFRVADCDWRSAAATDSPDSSRLDAARAALQELCPPSVEPDHRDRVWAESAESLADSWWTTRNYQNWGMASQHYLAALDWWAGRSELDQARRRYLDVVWRIVEPPTTNVYRGWNGNVGYAGPELLQNAARIAIEPEDRARAHYYLGLLYFQQGRSEPAATRTREELRAVLELGRGVERYDDALFLLGRHHEEVGEEVRDEAGNRTWRPQYVEALALYRRFLAEHRRGESRWQDDAARRIENITSPSLDVLVERFFLPGSEVAYRLNWRNTTRVDLRLVPVDLTRDPSLKGRDPSEWLESIPLQRLEERASWHHETGDDGKHVPGSVELTVEDEVPPGAYVLQARAGGIERRALVLVADASLTVRASRGEHLVWFTGVTDGQPIAGAEVHVWQRWHDGREWRFHEETGKTEADGTCRFTPPADLRQSQALVTARLEGRQAFASFNTWGGRVAADAWRVYAYTDRAVYRPEEKVSWKVVARERRDSVYATPAGEHLRWEVRDPMGTVAAEGAFTLNEFGAAWADLETTAAQPLGEYTVRFLVERGGSTTYVGQATLFRLEEFVAPEFEVSVELPDDPQHEGRKLLQRLGEPVSFDVAADYLFGAPVAGAKVEVFVFQRPLQVVMPVEHDYPWLYEASTPGRAWWGGPGQQVQHEVLATDDAGRAHVVFDTPRDSATDLEYTVEARVVDASRREIVGTGTVRVTRRAYTVELRPRHAIYRPGAAVEVDVRARTADGAPVQAEGLVEVFRDWWVEAWRDPRGKLVSGEALDGVRRELPVFPPPDQPGWTLVQRGYESELVTRTRVQTDEAGGGLASFTPARDGTYRVAWSSTDPWGEEVRAEAHVFVADERTRDLGYLPGGVDVLVDKDTFAVGDEASVVLTTPSSGRWVLFTVESEELLHAEVVHLDGTAKFLRVPVREEHVPNVWLTATSVYDGQAWTDQEEVVVPPVDRFLDVQASFSADTYLPGTEGELSLVVRDKDGHPVRTELGIAVVDDSLTYIQADYAGDPRAFFHGERRGHLVQLFGSFQHNSWVRLKKAKDGGVLDERTGERQVKNEQEGLRALGYTGGEASDSFFLGREARQDSAMAAPAMKAARGASEEAAPAAAPPGEGGQGGVEVRVRSDFRRTALWSPAVVTDDEGKASVRVSFPDSTTRWRAVARGGDVGSRFGWGETKVRTRQPLIARLQTPRFFQTGDELLVTGNLSNQTEAELTVDVTLAVQGLALLSDGKPVASASRRVSIPAGDQVRIDFPVRAETEGEAVLELSAVGQELGDAVRRTVPVQPHGIESLVAVSGKFDAESLRFTLDVPAARRVDSTRFVVQVTPSLAVTMLDALPYLIDYPYGCTEQTLSRFVPTAVVAGTLRELGLSAEDVFGRVFGGIEREHVAKTQPGGAREAARMEEMTRQGLERLYDFQHADGGWGWWKDGDSDRFMTAYVVWGLSLGRRAGLEVRAGVLERAVAWLGEELVEAEDQPNEQAWMLHAIAVHGSVSGAPDSRRFADRAFEGLFARRDRLSAYGRALLLIAAVETGRESEADVLAENLWNGVKIDETPDTSILVGGASRPFVQRTAHWGADGIARRWSDGAVETTAFCLRALLAHDPDHELVEPVVNWLVKNRRGAQWSNTRDTAITVLTLSEYLARSGELAGDVAFEVLLNGTSVGARSLSGAELVTGPSEFVLDPAAVRGGANEIEIRRTSGSAPLYFAARASFFSLEEGIPPRGNEVFVRRDYYALVGRPTLLKGTVYDRVLLKDGDRVESGQRVEVVLTLEAKNDLEYLMIEDRKPAGFEAVQVRSGEPAYTRELRSDRVDLRFGEGADEHSGRTTTREAHLPTGPLEPGYTGRQRWTYQELRDTHVAAFLDRLPEGVWELRYDLRAETPGSFHALPVQAHAMYVPEIRGNGAELRVQVVDGP